MAVSPHLQSTPLSTHLHCLDELLGGISLRQVLKVHLWHEVAEDCIRWGWRECGTGVAIFVGSVGLTRPKPEALEHHGCGLCVATVTPRSPSSTVVLLLLLLRLKPTQVVRLEARLPQLPLQQGDVFTCWAHEHHGLRGDDTGMSSGPSGTEPSRSELRRPKRAVAGTSAQSAAQVEVARNRAMQRATQPGTTGGPRSPRQGVQALRDKNLQLLSYASRQRQGTAQHTLSSMCSLPSAAPPAAAASTRSMWTTL